MAMIIMSSMSSTSSHHASHQKERKTKQWPVSIAEDTGLQMGPLKTGLANVRLDKTKTRLVLDREAMRHAQQAGARQPITP